ncbi:MAG: 50S ribosomal protein L22 [Clostridiales bacterium]|jgi:large subunit ribosomal protein L22|nr:50S ribosomal protein L22 [Clostridiales bacterium]
MAEKTGVSRSQAKKERNEKNKETRPRAHAKYIRLSDEKAKIVLDQIKGKDVTSAEAILAYSPRYAAYVALKVLRSAIANAENNLGLSREKLFVEEAYANRGSAHYGRFRLRPRAKGRGNRIERKMSHVSIILNEKK